MDIVWHDPLISVVPFVFSYDVGNTSKPLFSSSPKSQYQVRNLSIACCLCRTAGMHMTGDLQPTNVLCSIKGLWINGIHYEQGSRVEYWHLQRSRRDDEYGTG